MSIQRPCQQVQSSTGLHADWRFLILIVKPYLITWLSTFPDFLPHYDKEFTSGVTGKQKMLSSKCHLLLPLIFEKSAFALLLFCIFFGTLFVITACNSLYFTSVYHIPTFLFLIYLIPLKTVKVKIWLTRSVIKLILTKQFLTCSFFYLYMLQISCNVIRNTSSDTTWNKCVWL